MSKSEGSEKPQDVVSGDQNRTFADMRAMGTVGPAFIASPFQFKVPGANCSTSHFKPERDLPDLSGKVVLVTGGNTGLGKQSVIAYAKHNPAYIFLAARSPHKADAAIGEVKSAVPDAHVTHLPLDLSSLESVQAAADIIKSTVDRLDILLLNAGIMATPWGLTTEGYEIQLGTNHLGHALLTHLLLPLLLKTAAMPDTDVRVVAVSSVGHRMAPAAGFVADLEAQKRLDPWQRYGHSKLANVLFVQELARRHPQLTTAAVHPGIGVTDLYNTSSNESPLFSLAMKMSGMLLPDSKQLALNQLWATTSPKVESGCYYDPVGRKGAASNAGEDVAERLWGWTLDELRMKGFVA